jgi:ribonuclease R
MEARSTGALERKRVVDEIRTARGKGATRKQLERSGDWDDEELGHALAAAEARGEIIATGRNRYTALEYTDCFAGTLRVTSRSFGILRQAEAGQPEIIVPPEALLGALDGDFVLVRREMKRKKGQLVPERYGEVVRVLRRRRPTIVGRFVPDLRQPWVDPYARRLHMRVLLDPWEGSSPRPGEFVEVLLLEGADSNLARGRLLRRLGAPGEGGVDE